MAAREDCDGRSSVLQCNHNEKSDYTFPEGADMLRTQIQLREDQSRKLKEMAAEYDVSVAELIRQGIDLLIQSSPEATLEEKRLRATAVIGIADSGITDLATNHDHYLDEAYGDFGA